MEILDAFKWPIVFMGSLMFLAVLFKGALEGWIARWRGLKTVFRGLSTEIDSSMEIASSKLQDIKWNSGEVSHIYWLGHDLMYLLAVLNLAGNPDHVKHGFTRSLSNLQELGLPPEYEARLQAIGQTYNQRNHEQIGDQVAQFRMEIGNLLGKLKT